MRKQQVVRCDGCRSRNDAFQRQAFQGIGAKKVDGWIGGQERPSEKCCRFTTTRTLPSGSPTTDDSRFHLEGVEAGIRVAVYKIDADSGERLGLLATAGGAAFPTTAAAAECRSDS